MTGPATQEVEVVLMQRFLDSGLCLELNDRRQLSQAIELRKAELVAGLAHPVARKWTKKLQKEVEPLLRMRLDARLGFVIDRWVELDSWWHKIPGVIGFQEPRPGLCERMRTQYDMQKKATPKDNEDAIAGRARHPIMQEKDKASAQVIKANEDANTEKVLAAVDSLSTKRMENFLAVERARHTGEKLIHHGPDLKFVEHVEQLEKSGKVQVSEDGAKDCIAPGLAPKVHKRRSGGKHIRE